ncbi:MAG: hypothetical protein DHS20C18_34830 [Saprospiraceae bacterium]|nr:MAG: hypothetical protein DHS20C18_34830 [Saprospiraceae bacterium]
MKTTEPKTTTQNLHPQEARQPFFQEDRQGAFFSEVQPAVQPFFDPGKSSRQDPMFSASSIQPKLKIGKPGDRYEQEADAVADQVVKDRSAPGPGGAEKQPAGRFNGHTAQRAATQDQIQEKGEEKSEEEKVNQEEPVRRKPIFESAGESEENGVQRKCAACAQEDKEKGIAPKLQAKLSRGNLAPKVQRACSACQESGIYPEMIQRKGDGEASSSNLESQLTQSKGGGSPLPATTRSSMESSIGADFSGVRVHTGNQSAQMNQQLGAQAFTHGSDIYFNTGKYDPQSTGGQHLLAHELTHTVQQGGSSVQTKKENKTGTGKEASTPNVQTYFGESAVDWAGDKASGAVDWAADTAEGALDMGIDFVIDQIRHISPDLHNIIQQIRKEGVTDFFKTKLLQAVNGIFDGLQNHSAGLAEIFPQFGVLVEQARGIVNALATGDCKPLFAAVNQLKNLVTQLAGQAWDSIVEFFQPTVDFFSDLWQSFGKPALEWLKAKAAHIWNWVKQIGGNIWGWIVKVKDKLGSLAGKAWDYISDMLGLNSGESGEEGLFEWAQRFTEQAWESVKEELQPMINSAKEMVANVKAILPITAILHLRKTIQDWLAKVAATSTAMGEDASNVGNVAAQTSLRDQILPAIQQSIESFRGQLTTAAAWVNQKVGQIFTAVNQFFNTVRSISLLKVASGAIDWVERKVNDLNNWAQSKVTALFDLASKGLHRFGKFLQPIYDLLVKIVGILGDILKELPGFLMGPLWLMLPECIKKPIKDFFIKQILMRLPFFKKLQNIEAIWERLKNAAITALKQVFVDGNLRGAIWSFFSTMLDILGLPPQLVTRVIAKGAQALGDILNDPFGFLKNFLGTLKLGFNQFFGNIGTHLLKGLASWLFGQLQGSGIEMPQDLSFRSMLKLVFQLLGITVDKLLAILEQVSGQNNLKAKVQRVIGNVSNAWEWFEQLLEQSKEEGGSIWDTLKNSIGNIWDIILDRVIGWLEGTIIKKALAWVAQKLEPSGVMAVITTIIDIFNILEAIAEKAKEILEIIERVLDGIREIIKKVSEIGAGFLENALARAIPVAMAILSALFGLDGVIDRVKEVIQNIQNKVEEGIRKVMESIQNFVLKFLTRGKEEKEKDDGDDTLKKALTEINTEGEKETDEGEVTRDEAIGIKEKVNRDHPTVINITSVTDGGDTWNFEYIQKASAQVKKSRLAKGKNQKILGIIETESGVSPKDMTCRSNTLDRRIKGKVGDGMQAHHLISCSVANSSVLANAAAESGYDINNANNGILLPSSRGKWEQVKKDRGNPLPLHLGDHIESYYEEVRTLLQAQEDQARGAIGTDKAWTDKKLLSRMAFVEEKMASKLINYEITLSHKDPIND